MISDRYARKHNSHVHRLELEAMSFFKPYFHGTIYDLGCGERPYEKFIKDADCDYVGVDWSNSPHSMVADLTFDLNSTFPIETCSVDTILSTSVMEHLSEPQSFLYESFRILKRGMYMLVQVPFEWHVHEEPHDYFRFTRFGLDHVFKKAGFDVIDIRPQSGFWVSWILQLNYTLSKILKSRTFSPLWAADQAVARFLDKKFKNESNTIGYLVVAMKPHDKQES